MKISKRDFQNFVAATSFYREFPHNTKYVVRNSGFYKVAIYDEGKANISNYLITRRTAMEIYMGMHED